MVSTLLLADSCAYKRLTYLQDLEALKTYDVTEGPDVKIQRGDKIQILVNCTNPVLAAPFNLASASTEVDVTAGGTSSQGSATGVEYLVDQDGYLMFPILGLIHAEGMTINQLKEEISSQIISRNYIKDPIVSAEFTNFQITLLGEINTKGNIIIRDNKVTLLKAIAQAGDLTENANREEVEVIRTEDGRRTMYKVNLLSKECFESPAFYLQQNDIVYVKPEKTKLGQGFNTTIGLVSSSMTMVSSVTMIVYWVARFLGGAKN